jgi:LuxR family maltose regulon positive regulatory protein
MSTSPRPRVQSDFGRNAKGQLHPFSMQRGWRIIEGRRVAQEPTTLNNARPLLETKFYVPRRRGVVARPRLHERLARGIESKLSLVSAPAGFGKTTLLAEWLAAAPADGRLVAWLSLDPSDNELTSFWGYVIASLQIAAPGLGANSLSLLHDPQPPAIETILATLINELVSVPDEVVLVLNDYHLVDAPDIQAGMAFLLEHLPPQVHLVIATRADPALPLAGLRARGELAEIRAVDLRFTRDEAAAYLNEVMGLNLGASDVAALDARTEGWIAALQLAALSIQGRDDVAGFITGFAGDDRYIVDYLIEEVLHRQPEEVRSFLLGTSILDRLTGPLCDAVTGQTGGKTMLEVIDRGNLFLVPLDDRRQWYRYHQLFADVLRARLRDEAPDRVHELHRRASYWYEQDGDRSEAIRHALAADDVEHAADLIELELPALRRARQEAMMRHWLDAIPLGLFRRRPVLAIGWVASRLVSADLASDDVERVEARLRDAERWLNDKTSVSATTEMVVVDDEAFRRLPGAVALYRTALARASGDVGATITHAQRLLDVVDLDDHLGRAGAAGFLGLAHWTTGELGFAHRWWSDAAAGLERAGHVSDVLACTIALADIRIAQGRLGEAMRHYEQGLRLAKRSPGSPLRGVSDMHVGMSELVYEWNDLEAATQHLQASTELGDRAGLAQNPYRWCVAMARLREAEGNFDAAIDLLDEAERLYTSDYFPNVRPIPAMRARVLIRQGRLNDASNWAHGEGVAVDDNLSYVREFDHVTLARLLLARSAFGGRDPSQDGRAFLERLLGAAEQGGRWRSVIEILLLQAVAHRNAGDVVNALASMTRALTLAEPEGYVRLFVDELPSIATLLQAAAKQETTRRYARLLAHASGRANDTARLGQALIEPLSEREVDVLRLLATDMDGPGIANELLVSLSTVRSHTKSIYAKLGVNSRRAAVRRGEELDLMARAGR